MQIVMLLHSYIICNELSVHYAYTSIPHPTYLTCSEGEIELADRRPCIGSVLKSDDVRTLQSMLHDSQVAVDSQDEVTMYAPTCSYIMHDGSSWCTVCIVYP